MVLLYYERSFFYYYQKIRGDRLKYLGCGVNMRILVDADACPVVKIVERIAKKTNIQVILLCDTNHLIQSDYSEVRTIGAGADAVDFALVNTCRHNDIVVTQDYGVAAMVLGRGAVAIHQSGLWYTDENIDQMLMERYIAKQARRTSKSQLRGDKMFGRRQRKRTILDDQTFEISLDKLIVKCQGDQERFELEN
jgi:uncharacterized protein YaiI (UPF0178 family)